MVSLVDVYFSFFSFLMLLAQVPKIVDILFSLSFLCSPCLPANPLDCVLNILMSWLFLVPASSTLMLLFLPCYAPSLPASFSQANRTSITCWLLESNWHRPWRGEWRTFAVICHDDIGDSPNLRSADDRCGEGGHEEKENGEEVEWSGIEWRRNLH